MVQWRSALYSVFEMDEEGPESGKRVALEHCVLVIEGMVEYVEIIQ